jgi:hypothetical protein
LTERAHTRTAGGDALQEGRGQYRRAAPWLAAITALTLLVMVLLYFLLYPLQVGKPQPIPFSHRVHAGDKQISCIFCHNGVARSGRADIPPLQTCMLCHQKIIIAYPKIRELREHYFQNRPIEWVRVNRLPDYVFFDHSVHIHRQIDCGECHGDVKKMDRVISMRELDMGFCVQCHRDNGVTHDCWACHR